jgi:subtilisin family serine protease
MKKICIASLIALASVSAVAQSKLTPSAEEMLNNYYAAMAGTPLSTEGNFVREDFTADQCVAALVSISNPDDVDKIAALGYEIIDAVDHVVIVNLPLADVAKIADEDYIDQIEFGKKAHFNLDKARTASNADGINEGTADGLNKGYTGSGVVVGLMDQGVDPNHINFRGRVKGISRYSGSNGSSTDFTTEYQISQFQTDDTSATHGTHVLGIITGGYDGNVTEYSGEVANPYKGVAPGADIYVSAGTLYNNNILPGVKKVIDYANSVNKPAVVNLSLGSNSGSHDGLTAFGRTLDEYGQKAIIVVSAGNEGTLDMGVSKTFTADDKTLQTFFTPYSTTSSSINHTNSSFSGTVELYSSTKKPFTLKIAIVSAPTRLGGTPTIDNTYTISSAGTYTINNSNLDGFTSAVGSTATLKVVSKVDASYLTNRYQAILTFTNMSMANPKTGKFVALVIEGEEGQTVNGYCFSSTTLQNSSVYGAFWDRGFSGWTTGSPNGTINELACGKNLIVVGSYNTKNVWTNLAGGKSTNSHTIGDISNFSSYGTLYDGRNLPHVCAPGAGIVSSYSTYYGNLSGSTVDTSMVCRTTGDTRNNYWGQMQGTSMAAPYVSGAIALWLEADPTLTVADVQEIIAKTSVRDSYVEAGDQVQWGAGKLDVLAGLKEVISRNAGVGTIFNDSDKAMIITQNGDRIYDIYVAGENNLNATLYSINGAAVVATSATRDQVTLDASSVAPGVYVLAVNGAKNRLTRKLVIK